MGRLFLVFVLVGAVFGNPKRVKENEWEKLTKIDSDVDIKSNVIETDSEVEGIEAHIEKYIKNHEASFDLPILGSKVTLDARNLDDEEINLKLNFGTDVEARKKKKHKLKKLFVPILVFLVIKALTLIPLALGILGIKAWNATQLSFVSFVSSLAMAIWKLCAKVTHEPPQIIHQTYDPHLHHFHHDRSDGAQQMAYAGYAQQQ